LMEETGDRYRSSLPSPGMGALDPLELLAIRFSQRAC
jgi:hypothetical protein